MSSQQYRGHVIDVTCSHIGESIAYRCRIQVRASGQLRHTASSSTDVYYCDSAAEDRAFSDARGWIERFPLRWPFPAPQGSAG